MRRTVKKQFWMNDAEDQDLKEKARRTCLTEAGLIRLLIRGYEPKERPSDEFYEDMNELADIISKLEVMTYLVKEEMLAQELREEVIGWRKFRQRMEEKYIRPVRKRESAWQ